MTTKIALARLVESVPNQTALAKEAGVSTKTLQRIRNLTANPSLNAVESIKAAVQRLVRAAPKRRAKAQAGQGA